MGQGSASSTTFLASALFHLEASATSDMHHIVPMSDQAAFCNEKRNRTFTIKGYFHDGVKFFYLKVILTGSPQLAKLMDILHFSSLSFHSSNH